MSTLGGGRATRMRRALLALVLAADLCAASAVLVAGRPIPAAAQQSEADVFVAQAILAHDAKQYDEGLGLLKEALSQDPKMSRRCATRALC